MIFVALPLVSGFNTVKAVDTQVVRSVGQGFRLDSSPSLYLFNITLQGLEPMDFVVTADRGRQP